MPTPDDQHLPTTHTFSPSSRLAEASTIAPVSWPEPIEQLLARQPWPVGFLFLDEFEVEGILGQGGMGTVYLVRHQSTGVQLAVKRARLAHSESRRRFLAELQLWIDLPEHPHLAPCRFFRTVEDEVVIFTDVAGGGTLGDWIGQGRLPRVELILDIGIQVAWGLHALHERGLVHQDVKPANVLMLTDGTALVADFGVSRARARARQHGIESNQSILVTGGALTPAYCSPEQAQGHGVSRRTDIWSWGVLVLEMFIGKVPCCELGGPLARDVFQHHRTIHQRGLPLPEDVAEVLDLCLRDNPAERWSSLADAATECVRLYQEHTGRQYYRSTPESVAPEDLELATPDRRRSWSGKWDPPRKWLGLAYQAAGRDPTEVEAILPAPASTRRAQAVADLSAYEEAKLQLDRLVLAGRQDLMQKQATLYEQKALVHLSVSDAVAAQELFEKAMAIWEQLIQGWGRRELMPWLVGTCLHRARSYRRQGEHDLALALCDRVIQIWDRLDNRKRRREMHDDLAQAYLEKGKVLRDQARRSRALDCLDRAVELWEPMLQQDDMSDCANDLAEAYLIRANILATLGQINRALQMCDQAIQIRRRLVQRDDRRDLEGELAQAYVIKATVLRSQDRSSSSIPLYEQAIGLYEWLIEEAGRDDLIPELARACQAYAQGLRILGEFARASQQCSRAVSMLERLVQIDGRSELQHELARAYVLHAKVMGLNGDSTQGLGLSDQAIALYRRLILVDERLDLRSDLARAFVSKVEILRQLNKSTEALELNAEIFALRESLWEETGRDDLPAELARDRVTRAELLVDLGQPNDARLILPGAITTLEQLVSETGRQDLKGALSRGQRLLTRLLREDVAEDLNPQPPP